MSAAPAGAHRLPRGAAREIDRAARRAHRFHRFAHHPLCDRYAGEVFRVGGHVLCRGCVLGGAGIVVGLALGVVLAPAWPLAAGAVVLGAASLAVSRGKVGHRLLPAVGLNCAIGAGIASPSLAPLLVAGSAAGFASLAYLRWRRRGPNRTPCVACPERWDPLESTCRHASLSIL